MPEEVHTTHFHVSDSEAVIQFGIGILPQELKLRLDGKQGIIPNVYAQVPFLELGPSVQSPDSFRWLPSQPCHN